MFSLSKKGAAALAMSTLALAGPVPAVIRSAAVDATNGTILAPVSKAALDGVSFVKRDTVTPTTNVTLLYAGTTATSEMFAQINATMALPAVLLEDIASVLTVDCSTSSVIISFDTPANLEATASAWGTDSFILFTNHLGDCDAENERGLYLVDSFVSDATALTITASSSATSFNESTAEMAIGWTKPVAIATKKRSVFASFDIALPSAIDVYSNSTSIGSDDTESISIEITGASLSGNFDFSGYAHFSWSSFSFTDFYIDVDLDLVAVIDAAVVAQASYDTDLYSYAPDALSISAFSIPGILTVGPQLIFSLGVEFSATGAIDIDAELSASITDGTIHLDLVTSTLTTASNWTPTYTYNINISSAISAQLDPYISITAEFGIDFLSGLLDLSAGITAQATIVNVFDIEAEIDVANTFGVVYPTSVDATCTNGLWFNSDFVFGVTAFVTQFYTVELYSVDVPIYETGCWNFVDL